MNSHRPTELSLLIGFLAVLAAVPVTQTCLELARGQKVQFTDVFRYRPTARNLRQFEETLEEKSWFQRQLRPAVQRLLFTALRDLGAKGVLGRDEWLFYRPDLRYLVEADRLETTPADSRWGVPADRLTQREAAVRAIVRFRDQLRERGIALVVVPVPGKPSIYPDQVTGRQHPRGVPLVSPTLELIRALRHEDVATADLFAVFQGARGGDRPGVGRSLYLAQDTHWTPLGAKLAAEVVAQQLRDSQLAPAAAQEFQTRQLAVRRRGDVIDMLQIPGLRESFPPETVDCEQVVDAALGPLVPGASDRPGTYRYPGQQASVLVLGDSFCRIYQGPEPPSLGELPVPAGQASGDRTADYGAKRLLPGSAGFVSQLARALKSPVDSIVSDGGASTDVRRKLSTNPEILEGKKVVVWEFVERDIALGRSGWEDVALPAKLD